MCVDQYPFSLPFSSSGTGGIMTIDQTKLIVDSATRVDVNIAFNNMGEDAFNSFLSFALPRNIFTYRSLLPQSVSSLLLITPVTEQNSCERKYIFF